MGKYREQYLESMRYRDKIESMLMRNKNHVGYDRNSMNVQLNEAGFRASQKVYNHDLEKLEPLMLKEMQEEVLQQVMKDFEKGFKVDTSQLSKSIADSINSAMKSIGK